MLWAWLKNPHKPLDEGRTARNRDVGDAGTNIKQTRYQKKKKNSETNQRPPTRHVSLLVLPKQTTIDSEAQIDFL